MKANSGVRKALKARKNISSIQSDLVILHHKCILSRKSRYKTVLSRWQHLMKALYCVEKSLFPFSFPLS